MKAYEVYVAKSEGYLEIATSEEYVDWTVAAYYVAKAQVHATLALTARTGLEAQQ